mmetsp:Transcript_32685/g.52322  ORF Transcript_32685/g.52322 Transcript_32685/m.52322 type:complete len:178 (-) Transcript_32685:208-741(-)|eukprot:CAMPEP_0197033884 /NCGR_PEP_ID=MMETSP1384-20130603/12167_1 /TAXON_ID=29189 /ORGANISM="Ammonia sp." /LENGTH=177 /DNA_ID=CAMNT_0042463747 /DNA_START=33 /DNA_END=566 /DNA_ORIENTATION=+
MTALRDFHLLDLLSVNKVNLDPLTETYSMSFYMLYMARWPEYFRIARSVNNDVMGYIIGKAEGEKQLWHGHVSAVTVSPEYRRMGLATVLMNDLEYITDKVHKAWFVDLFVRASNSVAIGFYEKLGYSIYRTVTKYYSSDGEDAHDMRKPMSIDKEKRSLICKKKRIKPKELEWNTI